MFSKDIHGQLGALIYRRKQVWVLWKNFWIANSFDNFMLYGHGLALMSQLRSLNDSADSSRRFNGVKVKRKRGYGIYDNRGWPLPFGLISGSSHWSVFVLQKVLNVLTITLSAKLILLYILHIFFFSIYLSVSPLIATTNINFA